MRRRSLAIALVLCLIIMSFPTTTLAVTGVPTITKAELDWTNGRMQIWFSEGVYANTNGTGGLASNASNFTVTYRSNGGSMTNVKLTSLRTTGNGDPKGGETSFILYWTLTGGPPSGVETIELKPASNSIYSSIGTAVANTETIGVLTFPDKSPAAVNRITITPTSSTVVQGGTQQLTVVVDAVGGAVDYVTWTSSDTSGLVSVDEFDLVSVDAYAKVGTYTITATSMFNKLIKGTTKIIVVIPDDDIDVPDPDPLTYTITTRVWELLDLMSS